LGVNKIIKNLDGNKVSFGSIKEKLFTFKELETLINLRPFTSLKRFHSTDPNKFKYEWKNSFWASEPDCWPISIIDKRTREYSCYLSDCSRANKKINDMANKLEKKFKSPVDCHIYFSIYNKTKSFEKHKDRAHNFIVACEGKIKFEIFLEKKITKKLKTGDYVFIPAGVYHRAIPLTEKRISCSFPIKLPLNGFIEERKWLKIL